jgi:hypothetical protein
VLENRQAAVVRQVLVEADAGTALPQDAGQGRLADLERARASGPCRPALVSRRRRGRLRPRATPAEDIKPGEPALVAAAHFAIDQAGPNLEVVHGLDHEREAI